MMFSYTDWYSLMFCCEQLKTPLSVNTPWPATHTLPVEGADCGLLTLAKPC